MDNRITILSANDFDCTPYDSGFMLECPTTMPSGKDNRRARRNYEIRKRKGRNGYSI